MFSGQVENIEWRLAPKLPGNGLDDRTSNETMSSSIRVRVHRIQDSATLRRPWVLRFCLLRFRETVLPLHYFLASDGKLADI